MLIEVFGFTLAVEPNCREKLACQSRVLAGDDGAILSAFTEAYYTWTG